MPQGQRAGPPPAQNAKSRPETAFGGSCKPSYFIAPEAAIDDEAASIADEAAFIAEVAASEAAMPADIEDEAAMSGVVTMVVVEGVVDIVAGGVTVVVLSSFLLQAANETAAASVTINRAVFIFLLGGF